MRQIVNGFRSQINALVVHRDLKTVNLMVHFNGHTTKLMNMNKEDKLEFLKNVDLEKTSFQIKIADYGLSEKVQELEGRMK